MPPILHVMRHGQGFHSAAVSKNGDQIRDAELTEHGKEQCRQRCQNFTRHDKIDLLLASPLRRALQTTLLTFAPSISHGHIILALPHAEEVTSNPSDTGSPIPILQAEFGDVVDFDHLRHGWFKHDGEFSVDPQAVVARAAKLRRWIRGRPEREVVLVSHGFFNHFLTGEVDGWGRQTTGWWKEAELRTYTFEDGEDEVAMIYETKESYESRKGPN